jgi:hypothetical protein
MWSTAVVAVRISLIATVATIPVISVITIAAVVTTLSVVTITVITVPYWNEHTAAEQSGEHRKNENVFHIGSSFENKSIR